MRNIIIVDDDPLNNYMCSSLIKSVDSGISINSFTNPVKAFSFITESDLGSDTQILLDLNMPEMDGWEFLEKFKDTNKKYDVYIVTSSIIYTEKEKSKKYPVVKNFFSKPLSRKDINFIVNHSH